jgi:hypothetical protein
MVWSTDQSLRSRFNEKANNQPTVVSFDMMKKLRPKTDEDKRGEEARPGLE